ncbi:protoporphyrinogen/coproporphyrinogen oxidase [Yinghuangia seranimata]|uniref:protoporphyrinogen/coproporphyrinogen oxidase n=1 Tax=Yinghuangia seranimata TaxID=408067 RepID=UPI00248BF84E|nr:FAD-dependent oxidoreductase [Yinghuangia seranimata]MDI2127664.1 FAD-dependent oxidoreductase [Yinghuangia seranimata]
MLGNNVGAGRRVAVVGSGASGLAAAVRLERLGYDVELIEREGVLGGRMGVGDLGDRPVMMGGKNIGRKYSAFRGTLSALGSYAWEPFGINASMMKEGEVLTLDSTRRSRSVDNIRRMGRPADLARLAALAARIRLDERNKFLGAPYFAKLSAKYDHQPLGAHFGPGLADTLLRPMTVRMNGAEPDEVYLGTFNTNLALLMDTYDQLTDGIQPALATLPNRLEVLLDTEVEGLELAGGRLTGLRLSTAGKPAEVRKYDGVVLATPAYAAAQIVSAELPTLGKRLGDIRYFPSTVVLVEYDRPVFTPEVRALAMHDGGPCSNAGSYGMEDRHIVRYTFSGRNGRVAEPTESLLTEWVGATEERLTRYLGAARAKRVNQVSRAWAAAYCAYSPYHSELLTEVDEQVAQVRGLELAGDYLWGVSLEACSRSGNAAGDRLNGFLAGFAPAAR